MYSMFVYYLMYMYSIHIGNADIVSICVYVYTVCLCCASLFIMYCFRS